jgi:hypothetical protein
MLADLRLLIGQHPGDKQTRIDQTFRGEIPSLLYPGIETQFRQGGELICHDQVTTLSTADQGVSVTLASGNCWHGDQLVLGSRPHCASNSADQRPVASTS